MLDVNSQPLSKVCTQCRTEKWFFHFPIRREKKRNPYMGSECRECASNRAKDWQKANYDRAFARQKQWRQENRLRFNELMRDISKRYLAAKKRATPLWADHQQIEAVYTEAWCRRFFGEDAEVDHYYPFQGKTVCGLHVHQNLRIMSGSGNREKRNFHPDDELNATNA